MDITLYNSPFTRSHLQVVLGEFHDRLFHRPQRLGHLLKHAATAPRHHQGARGTLGTLRRVRRLLVLCVDGAASEDDALGVFHFRLNPPFSAVAHGGHHGYRSGGRGRALN